MGGIVNTLFGGSKSGSTQTSENQAYPTLLNLLSGNIGQGNSAMSTLGGLLGIGGPDAAAAADGTLNNFLDSTGYKFMLDSGSKAITGNAASKGLLNSGYTGKALTSFGQNLGMTKVGELMDKLTNLGSYGLNSAGIISGAGNKSTGVSKGNSSNGIFNSLFPGGLSDRRSKRCVKDTGFRSEGLCIYEYEYVFAPGIKFIGVMADEVAVAKPDAMGPKVPGERGVLYDTVDYSKIAGLRNGPILVKEAVNG